MRRTVPGLSAPAGCRVTGLVVDAYPWLKAAHLVSVIAWMAGLLYLPRLFVYHCTVAAGSAQSELFKVMERRLYRAIMTPAMLASWVFGLLLVVAVGAASGLAWLFAKFALVLALTALHGVMGQWRHDFADDRNRRPQSFYRIANEAPTLLMIAIVVVAVVKPF